MTRLVIRQTRCATLSPIWSVARCGELAIHAQPLRGQQATGVPIFAFGTRRTRSRLPFSHVLESNRLIFGRNNPTRFFASNAPAGTGAVRDYYVVVGRLTGPRVGTRFGCEQNFGGRIQAVVGLSADDTQGGLLDRAQLLKKDEASGLVMIDVSGIANRHGQFRTAGRRILVDRKLSIRRVAEVFRSPQSPGLLSHIFPPGSSHRREQYGTST